MPWQAKYYDPYPNEDRQADIKFYKSAAWQHLRRWHLARNPICVDCQAVERLQVHHVIPRKVDPSRALDPTNLKTLCIVCHAKVEKASK